MTHNKSSTERLSAAFQERFGGPATHYARAPGRANLIGEHTDYNGLAVLPMALQREARVAFRPRSDGMVVLHTVDGSSWPRPRLERRLKRQWKRQLKRRWVSCPSGFPPSRAS
jgi:galactokinase